MNLIKLAARNIRRHRKRSTVTILTICLGFTALGVIGGIVNNIYSRLKGQAIVVEKLGHITFAKEGFFANGKIEPEKYLWTQDELDRIQAVVRADERVAVATPRLSLLGIASNGNASTVFLTEAIVPADDRELIETPVDGRRRTRGATTLAAGGGQQTDVAIGSELAANLGLEEGDFLTLLTTTKEGMANAVDVDIRQVFNTGNPATNDKYVLTNFELAQDLYDTRGAQRLVVTLHEDGDVDGVRDELVAQLTAAGLSVEARSWDEQSLYYAKIRTMFGAIFRVLTIIITVVIVLTLLNTMQMAVAERTQEIGTMRAIGMQKAQIIALFCLEGIIMGVVACALSVPILLGISQLLKALDVTFIPPVASVAVPIALMLQPKTLVVVFVLFCLAALVSSFSASLRIARQNIVDSLTKAI